MAQIDYFFETDEIKPIGININETTDTPFTISAKTIEIKQCPEGTIVLAETSTGLTEVQNTTSNYDISYLLDVSNPVYEENTVYQAIFKATLDSGQVRKGKLHFKINPDKC